jgi:hypothetical protein
MSAPFPGVGLIRNIVMSGKRYPKYAMSRIGVYNRDQSPFFSFIPTFLLLKFFSFKKGNIYSQRNYNYASFIIAKITIIFKRYNMKVFVYVSYLR